MAPDFQQPSLLDAEEVAEDEDQLTRTAIATALDTTLFVEAGAGSGKTKSLVDRVVALITVEGVPMREIVAVTFTDKAAAELRDRIRRELERVATRDDAREVTARAAGALEELDGAAVSTLHAFAQRILSENPIEAGLPPRIEVLDDIASQVAFDERWTRFLDRARRPHPRTRAAPGDQRRPHARQPAHARGGVQLQLGPRRGTHRARARPATTRHRAAARRARRGGRASRPLHRHRRQARRGTREAGDLAGPARRRARRVRAAAVARTRVPACAHQRREEGQLAGALRGRRGSRADRRGEAAGRSVAPHHRGGGDPPPHVGDRPVHPGRSGRPARSGELEFHDLLVLARVAARPRARLGRTAPVPRSLHPPPPRRVPGHRPDPVRPRRLLASAEPDARNRRWDEITTDPGRLFVVGDPKQSIYRFRRADIAAFLRARSAFGATPQRLTRNYRSTRPVIEFVNHVFRDLIVAEPESQPEYVALAGRAHRRGLGCAGRAARRRGPRRRRVGRRPARTGGGRRRRHHHHRARRRVGGRPPTTRRHLARSRAGSATSACSSPPARRSVSSRTRSTPPASRTAPRHRRSSTARARSATCSWCSKPSTTRPTSSRS